MVGDGADAVDYELIRVCHKGDIVVSQDYGVTAIALGRGSYAILILVNGTRIRISIRCSWSVI